ncbi:hypothetical protein WA158_002491 [Blastocystis sp. Blastoise]
MNLHMLSIAQDIRKNSVILRQIIEIANKATIYGSKSIKDELEDEAYKLWVTLELPYEKFHDILVYTNSTFKLVDSSYSTLLNSNYDSQTYIRSIRSKQFFFPASLRLYICPECLKITNATSSRNSLSYDDIKCFEHNDISDDKMYHTTILPIIPRIKRLLSNADLLEDISFYKKDDIMQLLSLHSHEDYYIQTSEMDTRDITQNTLVDIPYFFYGSTFYKYTQPLVEKGDIFLFFSVTSDGITVFNKPQKEENKSSYPITLKLLNYNQQRKYDHRKLWCYACPTSNMISPLIDILSSEFQLLNEGLDIYIDSIQETKRVIGILLNVYGDYPAVSKMVNTPSSSSVQPCRFCRMTVRRSRDSAFHEGIKCCYEESREFRISDEGITTFFIPTYCPNDPMNTNNIIVDYIDESNIDANMCVSLSSPLEIPSSSIYSDSLTLYSPVLRSSESSSSIIPGTNEVSPEERNLGFSKLTYFNILQSCSLDPMHLINNVATSLMEYLWNYPKTNAYSKLKYTMSQNEMQDFITRISLNEENKKIIMERIKDMNILYDTDMYQLISILNDLNFYSSTSHTRILLFSTVFPILLSDFTYEDSPLILIIEIFGSLISDIMRINPITEKDNLLTFEKKCIQFVSIIESILPSALITTQIHSIKHLASCIRDCGSLFYTSTWEAERSYRNIKRITKGTKSFNESVIIKVQDQESIQIHIAPQISSTTADNNTNDGRFTSLQHKEILIKDNPEIKSFKGKESHSLPNIIDRDKLAIILLLSSKCSSLIQSKLFSEVFHESDTPYRREEIIRNNIDIQTKLLDKFKLLRKYCYDSVIVNNNILFRVYKGLTEGAKNNSYILRISPIQSDSGDFVMHPFLYSILSFIQIEDVLILKLHKYPVSNYSQSRLYAYFINRSKTITSQLETDYEYFLLDSMKPFNIICVDFGISKEITNDINGEYIGENNNNNSTLKKINRKDSYIVSVFIPYKAILYEDDNN